MIYVDGSYMVADTPAELHAFAKEMGLRSQFYDRSNKLYPHYNIWGNIRKLIMRDARVTYISKPQLLDRAVLMSKRDYFDANKTPLSNDDIIFDNEDYYRVCLNPCANGDYLLSCTKGYDHDMSQKNLKRFKKIGTFATHKHLLVCD